MENKKEEQKKDFQQTKYYCDQTQDLHNVMVLANNEQGGFVILQEVKHPDYKNSARTFVVYRNKHSVRKHFGMGSYEEKPSDHIACQVLNFVTKTGEEVGAEIDWEKKYGKKK